jgi:hypothetical protein
MPVQLVETGVKFPDGTTQITAATTPVTSVNGQTGAVNISIPPAGVTSVNGLTGAVNINTGSSAAGFGASSGYQIFPSGFMIVWGGGTYPNATWLTTSLPIAFPNVCVSVHITILFAGAAYNTVLNPYQPPTTTEFTHFTYQNPTNVQFRFMAIGY